MRFYWLILFACLAGTVSSAADDGGGAGRDTAPQAEAALEFVLTSPAFKEGDYIPKRHSCQGANLSPPLRWDGVPKGTASLALICEDPDAPSGLWVHWIIFNLPDSLRGLNEGVQARGLPAGVRLGKGSNGRLGYHGPCPPPGKPHRYIFRLIALNAPLDLPDGVDRDKLEQALSGRAIAECRLMGLYRR